MSAVPQSTSAAYYDGFVPSTTPSAPNSLQPALSLGGITFADNEHPDKLPIPLESRQAVHEMIGGYRKVHNLGPQPNPISWSGTFWDSTAVSRAAAIKAMQIAGAPVTLTWNTDSYTVLIAKFTRTVIDIYRITYDITCTVVADLSTSLSASTVSSLDTQTQALLSSAQNALSSLQNVAAQAGTVVPTALSTGLAALGVQINGAGPLAQAAISSVVSITATCSQLNSTLAPYLSLLNNAMVATSSGAINPGVLQSYMYASDLNSAVSLISANVQTGQVPVTVSVAGGISLFHVAAQYYGAATLAPTIMTANGLTSTSLPAGTSISLRLPPATANPLS